MMKITRMMTKPTILAWTDRPAQAIVLAVITIFFFALAAIDVYGLRMVTVLLMGFVVITAVLGGGALGLVAGLVGAAVFIGIHIAAGQWNGRDEAARLVVVAAFLAYGGLCGVIAGHLRHRHSLVRREPAAAGAGGSLGLLTAQQGRAVLLQELERTRSTGEPLGLLTVHATEAGALGEEALQHALRAVARSVESMAGNGVFPVLLEEDRFGVIFRNHDTRGLAVVRDQLLSVTSNATFADRAAGTRRTVRDALHLQTADVVLSGPDAEAEVLRAFSGPGGGADEDAIRAAA